MTTTAKRFEAAQILQDQPALDLIVTDLMLPGPPVMELLTELRRTHPDLPVVAVTRFLPADRARSDPFSLIPQAVHVRATHRDIARLLAI